MLAALVRSGLVETTHEGAIAAVAVDGSLIAFSGDVHRPFYFRSAAKPFQAAACLRAGFDPPLEHLAIACSSHPGEPVHVAVVTDILYRAGLDTGALRCPPEWPLSIDAAHRLMADGEGRSSVFHNCSGKHASWLATSVVNGWDIASYLDPAHPVQGAIFEVLSEVGGSSLQPSGIDGCGAPVYQTSVLAMAGAFARLGSDPEFRRVFSAMNSFPALIGQDQRADRLICTWLDAVAKGGAAGCLGVALRDGTGIAVKCWDGSDAAAGVGAIAALEQLGRIPDEVRPAMEAAALPPVIGGVDVVGKLEPRLELRWS